MSALYYYSGEKAAGPMKNLDTQQLETLLADLDGWQVRAGKLNKVFEFDSFVAAFGFMTQVAFLAEKMDHHPDWSNSYRMVTVDLVTHSTGGITSLDIDLAAAIDKQYGKSSQLLYPVASRD